MNKRTQALLLQNLVNNGLSTLARPDAREAFLAILKNGPMSRADVEDWVGAEKDGLSAEFQRLREAMLIEEVAREGRTPIYGCNTAVLDDLVDAVSPDERADQTYEVPGVLDDDDDFVPTDVADDSDSLHGSSPF